MPSEKAWSHVLLILATCCQAWAAVHQYDGQLFYQVGDAFIFRGGREGLYASTQEVSLTRLLVPCHQQGASGQMQPAHSPLDCM